MSRRVLLCGGPDELRRRLAAEVDAGFDVVLDEAPSVLDAVRLLPTPAFDLVIVLAEDARVPGLDLVRLLEGHAQQRHTPVLFVGGDERDRTAALATGAEQTLPAELPPGQLSDAVAELLDLG